MTTKPAYDGWNVVQERASDSSVLADYLTGLSLDQPFLRTAGSSTSYYLSDALGSIVGLADQTGAVPTTYTYEPYGKTTASGTASANFLGFTGRENDSTASLSLYNYRGRSFSPTLQRFMTEDPLGLTGGDVNLYSYVANGPTYRTDPSGMFLPSDSSGNSSTAALRGRKDTIPAPAPQLNRTDVSGRSDCSNAFLGGFTAEAVGFAVASVAAIFVGVLPVLPVFFAYSEWVGWATVSVFAMCEVAQWAGF